jgi:hypothetical protein
MLTRAGKMLQNDSHKIFCFSPTQLEQIGECFHSTSVDLIATLPQFRGLAPPPPSALLLVLPPSFALSLGMQLHHDDKAFEMDGHHCICIGF